MSSSAVTGFARARRARTLFDRLFDRGAATLGVECGELGDRRAVAENDDLLARLDLGDELLEARLGFGQIDGGGQCVSPLRRGRPARNRF